MSVQAGTQWRLREPVWPRTVGQGPFPGALVIEQNGRRYQIPWGTIVQASLTCDPAGGVANLNADPPLVRCHVIEEMSSQFEPLSPSE